jgi:hypothetical protein
MPDGTAAFQVAPSSTVRHSTLLPSRMSHASDDDVTEKYPVVPESGSEPVSEMSFGSDFSPGAAEAGASRGARRSEVR